jgi:hypothetical protein
MCFDGQPAPGTAERVVGGLVVHAAGWFLVQMPVAAGTGGVRGARGWASSRC